MTTQDNATAIVVAMIEKGLIEARNARSSEEHAEAVADAFRVVYAAVKSPALKQVPG